jgi:cell shape-determining protein MreD
MKIIILLFLSLFSLSVSLNSGKILLMRNISFKPIILLLYFVTLYWNPLYGLFAGFFLGFIYEIYLPVFTGTYPLIFSSVVFGLHLIEKKIFKFRYNSLILLFLTFLFIGLIQVMIEVDKLISIPYVVLTRLIPEAILNSAVGFVILYFIKKHYGD